MKKDIAIVVIILLIMTPIITYAMPISFEKSDSYNMQGGRVLITESLAGRVIEVDNSGSIVWQKTDLDTPMDSERLENGNTLISESGRDRVIEVSRDGTIVWEKNGLNGPVDVERLSNGNTLITEEIGEKVSEVDFDGNEVWNITNLHAPKDAERLGNGNTLIVEYGTNRIIEVTNSGTIVWLKPDLSGPIDVERDDIGMIITEYLGGRVFDGYEDGWEITGLDGPVDAERRGNGNILISEYNGSRIIEVNSSGIVVWEKTNLSGPIDVESWNQPPSVEIINPKVGYLHISGISIIPTPLDLIADTMSIGGFRLYPVIINATDDVDNSSDLIVNVFLNGEYQGNATYCCDWRLHEWFWTGLALGNYNLTITAEDSNGAIGSAEMNIWNLCFLP